MLGIKRLDTERENFSEEFSCCLIQHNQSNETTQHEASDIVEAVRTRGDAALLDYTNQFDKRTVTAEELMVSKEACRTAFNGITRTLQDSLTEMAHRIRNYHERQLLTSWQYADEAGVVLGQRITPIQRVGIYVPGGKASYPSSVLMNALPAKIAGVEEIIMTVPAPGGTLNPMVLAAAHLCEVNQVFSVGGAQAIAALAYGTDTIPKVDKIVGPGNQYVAAAKKRVFGDVGIDMVAGPSEVTIISDGQGSAAWVALDLCAQAEHDEAARVFLLSPDANFISAVEQEIERRLPSMARAAIIKRVLSENATMIVVRDLDEAAALSNRLAPEHLQLAVADPNQLLSHIKHAGAIFLGHYATAAYGDYAAGPNHVLPTNRSARFSSPLGVYDFQKRSSIIGCDQVAARYLSPLTASLAIEEGLTVHAAAAEARLHDMKPSDG